MSSRIATALRDSPTEHFHLHHKRSEGSPTRVFLFLGDNGPSTRADLQRAGIETQQSDIPAPDNWEMLLEVTQ